MIEFGPLDALARDPTVTDVAITCEGRVWADRGGGMTECRLPMPLRTPRIVREYAVRLCAQLGRRLDDACPIADASSEDGIRVHAVIAPLVAQGAAVTIRFPDRRLLGLTGLRDAGMFPPDWLTLLRNLVKNRARVLISGGTGSGKTTLTEMLTERYGAKAYYEQSDNPYIGDFYNDMNRWSFNLQMYFLGSRIQQTMDILRSGPVDIFQDRTVYEDANIFADNLHRMGLMSGRDFDTYMSIFGLITNLVPRPDLLIYLKASVPTLISQIRRRGRAYEMNIDEQYLRRLNDRYDDWIEHIYRGEVLVIDKDREDFVADAAVMEKICARLDRKREELENAKK